MAKSKKGNAIHDLSSLDATVMLPLNNAHAKETSMLDDASLTALLDMAFFARGID
jgi:predicted GNAT superfamily acetyltransferase